MLSLLMLVSLHLYAAGQAVSTPTVIPEEANYDSPASNPICKQPVDLGTQCNGTGSNPGNSTSNLRVCPHTTHSLTSPNELIGSLS